MDLTYTNLILMVGRHIFILVIGIMAVTFGIETPWPTSQVRDMIKQKQVPTNATKNSTKNQNVK
jgi:sRNA-binding carbon storage regulator CsrA